MKRKKTKDEKRRIVTVRHMRVREMKETSTEVREKGEAAVSCCNI
jgi:hypothetical protein